MDPEQAGCSIIATGLLLITNNIVYLVNRFADLTNLLNSSTFDAGFVAGIIH